LAGCGGPNAAKVAGRVTLDGQPLANATVTFHPVGKAGAIAYGTTDADGRYELATGSDAGLTPGEYNATVLATVEVAPAGALAETTFKTISPAKYADATRSGLTFTVKRGSNDFPLTLTSQ